MSDEGPDISACLPALPVTVRIPFARPPDIGGPGGARTRGGEDGAGGEEQQLGDGGVHLQGLGEGDGQLQWLRVTWRDGGTGRRAT